MIKIKNLGFIAIASSTLLFSGCVHTNDTFHNNGHHQGESAHHNTSNVSVSLRAYAYPYYYNKPYYYMNNMYYYGGYYDNGFYHYGQQRFRHGHYYNRGYRYYRGNRYRAVNGNYGYYNSRSYYERSPRYKRNKARSLERGRTYDRARYPRKKTAHMQTNRRVVNSRNNVYTRKAASRGQHANNNHPVSRRVRSRN